ncbi:MarR family winged helix-turn-helix transcriptional regulator [Brevundimonas nasdae]|uniref:MarR family winged helix-turn-helix transcriptional regulator n=1 Tax=Brevundimonas nasdae TaxID=172043 RepID=UPI003F690AAA
MNSKKMVEMSLPDKNDPAKESFDLFSSPFYLIAHAEFKYHEDLDKAILKFDLDRATYRILTVLMQRSPINIKDLAHLSLLKRSTVSRALARMAREGWVETSLNVDDNRITDVYLTEAGKLRSVEVMKLGSRQLQRAVDGLGAADLDELTRILKRLIGNLSKLPIE